MPFTLRLYALRFHLKCSSIGIIGKKNFGERDLLRLKKKKKKIETKTKYLSPPTNSTTSLCGKLDHFTYTGTR